LTDEERYTFSSLMSLLIEIEGKLGQLYEAMVKTTDEPKLKSLLSDYHKNSLKRMEMMRRARVESVVEFTLQPITGLKLTEPMAKMHAAIESKSPSLEKTMTIEKAVSELYVIVSPKIIQISADTGELLLTLSRESTERFHELEQHVKPV